MSASDTIAEQLTIIRNACMAGIPSVKMTSSKMRYAITKILKEQGYVQSYITQSHKGIHYILIDLKYSDSKVPAISGIKRISKPGRRVYKSCEELPSVRNNYGVLIVTTSKGVMTGREAAKLGIGGELICSVW